MQTCSFPLCCGAEVLCDFGYTSTSQGTRETIDKEDVRAFLKEQIEYYVKRRGFGFLTAILNNTQMTHLGDIFLEEGFQVVSKGWHAGHPQTQPLHLLVYARSNPNDHDNHA